MSNYVSISNPCGQNVDKMSMNAEGYYCHQCKKCIIDFSCKSDQEVLVLLGQAKDDVCGILHAEQLDRALLEPIKVSKAGLVKSVFSSIAFYLFPFLAIAQNKSHVGNSHNSGCTDIQAHAKDDCSDDSCSNEGFLDPIEILYKSPSTKKDLFMGSVKIVPMQEDIPKSKSRKKWWMFWKRIS